MKREERKVVMATRKPWYLKNGVRAPGLAAGSVAVVIAAAITTGAQLTSSPIASAVGGGGGGGVGFGTADPGTPTATVSGVADASKAATYWAKVNQPATDIENAVQAVSNAVNGGNQDTLKNACQQLSDAGEELRDTLPSPDSEVTPRIQAAVDNIKDATNTCMTFGPSSTQADLDKFTSLINDARAHIKSAQHVSQLNSGG
jgi:hypothetical protein